jgi:hypothetical protein
MRPTLLFIVVAFCCASVGTTRAQQPSRTQSMFSNEALVRALPPDSAPGPGQVDSPTRWDRVRTLRRSTEIFVTTRDAHAKKSRFLSADDRSVTVVDVETLGRPTVQIARDEVMEISCWVCRPGSVAGAIAGAGGGFLLGFVTSVGLANKMCGSSCGDEQVLMAASLIGMPIAGAVLGYGPSAGKRQFRTIYLRP